MHMAALYDVWHTGEGDQTLATFTILTTDSSSRLRWCAIVFSRCGRHPHCIDHTLRPSVTGTREWQPVHPSSNPQAGPVEHLTNACGPLAGCTTGCQCC